MKLSLVNKFLFGIFSLSSSVAGSSASTAQTYPGNNDKRALATIENTKAVHNEQIVPLIIGATELAAILLGVVLVPLANHPHDITAKPKGTRETGQKFLQKALLDYEQSVVKAKLHTTAIAVRASVPQTPAWTGTQDQDWTSSVLTVNGADGTSTWNIYFVNSGSITVTTSNPKDDVVTGGSGRGAKDPNNPSLLTITIDPLVY